MDHIYVLVNIDGKAVVAKGGVYSYYKFFHGSPKPLTDEAWQQKIRSWYTVPDPPVWKKSYWMGYNKEVMFTKA